MDDLSYLFPTPEPVVFGGELYQAVCFRLRDLARLHRSVKAIVGDPLDNQRMLLLVARESAAGEYAGSGEAARRYAAALRPVVRGLIGWPPSLWSIETDRLLFGTTAGQIVWLVTLLERTHPGFTGNDAVRVAARATAEEWLKIKAVAYADHPADWLSALMDPPRRRTGPRRTWGEIVESLATERGWTYEQIGDLYLSQLLTIAVGGQWEPGSIEKRGRRDPWYAAVLARRATLLAGAEETNGTAL